MSLPSTLSQNILDHLREGCLLIGTDWQYRYLNEAACRQMRRERGELIGHTLAEADPAITQTELYHTLETCMRDGVARQCLHHVNYPDHSGAWFDVAIHPSPEGLVLLWLEVAGQKLPNLLESIIDNLAEPAFALDREYQYLAFNHAHALAMKAIYQVEIEVGKNMLAYMTLAADREAAKGNLDRALNGEQFTEEAVVGDQALSQRNFEITHTPVRAANGEVTGLTVLARDITEQKKAQALLTASERKYRTLFETMSEGVALHRMIFDAAGKAIDYEIVEVNSAFERHTGLSAAQAAHRPATQVYATDTAPFLEVYAQVEQSGESTYFESYFPPMDRYFEISVFRPEKGWFATVFSDVTERRRADQALRESEQQYRLLTENMADVVWIIDAETHTFRYISPSVERLLGYLPEEIAMWPIQSTLAPETGPIAWEQMRAHLDDFRSGQLPDGFQTTELQHTRKDGTVIWTENVSRYFSNPDNGRLELHGVTRDITPRKRSEEKIRRLNVELEQRVMERTAELSDLYNNAPCGYHSLDETGVLVRINDTELNWLGYTREELIGKVRFTALLTPDSIKTFETNFPKFLKRGRVDDLQFDLLRKDGSTFPILLSGTAVRDEHGHYLYSRSTMIDHTQQRAAEKARHESQEKLAAAYRELRKAALYTRSLIEASLDPLVVIRPDGQIADVNLATELATGYPRKQLVGNDFSSHFTEPEQARSIYARVFAEGFVRDTPLAILHRSGATTDVILNASVYKNDAGEVQGILAAARDITERKKAEEAIFHLNERLEGRTAELEASNKELEAFAYSVSHDLRAPLRAIDGFSRILAEEYAGQLDAEGKRQLDIIRTNTRRMDQLMTDLLSLSRVSSITLSFERIDMTELARTVYQETTPAETREQFAFTCPELPDAYGDRTLLRQVWANLFSNAIKYTLPSQDRRIEVGAFQEKEINFYYVKDSGVGFDSQYTHKLFGVFQRLHKLEEFEGTGVGLAIVRRIVERHGGITWAEGRLNQGATIYFSLPGKENKS